MARDLSPIHPDLLDYWKKFPRIPLNRWTVRLVQWLMGRIPMGKGSETIEIRNSYIQSEDSPHKIMLRVHKPKTMQSDVPALLWIHGGGLVIGSAALDDAYLARFVDELGIVVVSVEYRLAPRHPYPAALEDCYTALKWLVHHAPSLGIDSKRIAIGGVSAGGGLAASLAQYAYDKGEVHPAFQLMVYPMLDDRSALPSNLPHQDLMTWTIDNNRFGWSSYLGQAVGLATVAPYAVPARREDLTGLPPAWIGVGSLDLFCEEDVAYAEKLKACGVACELVVLEGAFHGFDVFGGDIAAVQTFRESQIAALRKYLMLE